MSETLAGKIIFVIFAISQVCPEKIEVVTPVTPVISENAGVVKEIGNEWNSTEYDDDSYMKAYREIINTAERRNPGSDYAEESSYNTLAHSSYIDHHVYPELNQNTHSNKFHRHHPPAIYGPPSPVSHYSHYHHHHHHPHIQQYPSQHIIPILSPFHFVTSFLAKFGLQKIFNLIAKIVVLKIILKFVAIIALFLVLPSFLPNKDKETDDDDRLLNDVTTWVWNGITENEEEEEEEEEEMGGENGSGDHEEKEPEKEEEEEEMDETTQKLLNKIIKEWKEENFGGPGKEAGVKFLTQFLDIINRILGALMGYVKMKNNNMDDLDSIMINKFTLYAKQLTKLWPKLSKVVNLAG